MRWIGEGRDPYVEGLYAHGLPWTAMDACGPMWTRGAAGARQAVTASVLRRSIVSTYLGMPTMCRNRLRDCGGRLSACQDHEASRLKPPRVVGDGSAARSAQPATGTDGGRILPTSTICCASGTPAGSTPCTGETVTPAAAS